MKDKNKLYITVNEYNKLDSLLKIVNDKSNSSGNRRIAMFEFKNLMKKLRK